MLKVPRNLVPPTLRLHLALLERTMTAKDFRIDACGFFKVDLSLFMAIMGASVTYTVMLAQSNNQLSQLLASQAQSPGV